MAKAAEKLSHPVFGELVWQPDYSYWAGQLDRPGEGALDLWLDPGDEDRHAFLKRAADLFKWALANERRILSEAFKAELLELYNESWRQDDEPELTADELTEQLDWQLLAISDSELVPVEFSYGAGDLFGGHGVTIEVDDKLEFRDIDLRG